MDGFDFDTWAVLARAAPDKFEQRRREVVEGHISNSGDICRLQGLQCRIDLERRRARTPLKSCLRLSTLMWDEFINVNNALNTFVHGDFKATNVSSQSKKGAKIIQIQTERKLRK